MGRNEFPQGVHGNGWNNAATGAGGVSGALDTLNLPFVSVFGTTSGASSLIVQLSQDGTNYYDSEFTISANGNFGNHLTSAARFVRLKSTANVTATATISAKG